MQRIGKLIRTGVLSETLPEESKNVANFSETSKVTLKRSDPSNSSPQPVLFPLKPYHERLLNYNAVRAKIFSESNNSPTSENSIFSKPPKRNSRRFREFKSRGRKFKLEVTQSICAFESSEADLRLFASVQLLDKTWNGLLDSGATISCISGQASRKQNAI